MKKRLFVVLAVLALTVCLLPMVVGAECAHEWDNYTEIPTYGQHTKTCSLCNTTVTEQCTGCDKTNCSLCGSDLLGIHPLDSTNHCAGCGACTDIGGSYAYNDSEHWYVCTLGHDSWPSSHEEHSYANSDCATTCSCGRAHVPGGHNLSEATCTENKKCQNPGCTYEVENSALGHSFTGDNWYIKTQPTCTNKGVKYHYCANGCGENGEKHGELRTLIKELGHTYKETTDNPALTCQNPVTETVSCERCKKAPVEKTFTTDCVAVCDNNAVEDTCTTIGKTASWSCKWCGDVKTPQVDDNPYKTHNYASRHDEIPATCEKDGSAVDYCTNGKCGSGKPVVLPALDHDWADATCTAPKTCKREGCGKTEGKELGHDWDDGVVIKQATGFATGIKLYTCKNDPSHTYEKATPVLYVPDDPNLDRVPRTGNAFIEWLYALIAG